MQSTAGKVAGESGAADGARGAQRRGKRRRVAREAGALPFKAKGGARPGAGRKPKGEKAGVPHRRRREFSSRCPVHVTVKLLPGMARLRRGREYRALRAAFAAGCDRNGFRLVHYAVMNDHLHLIVEADGARAFVRGVQGLLIRVARALNRVWRRRGKVFGDRYHDHVLATPREVRNAIRYVLNNAEHHERQGGVRQGAAIRTDAEIDVFTSGPWFDGWLESVVVRGLESAVRPIARARTWLLGVGWQRLGRLSRAERAAS
jgi:REP element-mobilizing transposase RayT